MSTDIDVPHHIQQVAAFLTRNGFFFETDPANIYLYDYPHAIPKMIMWFCPVSTYINDTSILISMNINTGAGSGQLIPHISCHTSAQPLYDAIAKNPPRTVFTVVAPLSGPLLVTYIK